MCVDVLKVELSLLSRLSAEEGVKSLPLVGRQGNPPTSEANTAPCRIGETLALLAERMGLPSSSPRVGEAFVYLAQVASVLSNEVSMDFPLTANEDFG